MKKNVRALLVALSLMALLLAAVAGSAAGATRKASPPTLNVFAAASLSHAFPAMVAPFKRAYPSHKNLRFVFNFQGTDVLVQQIEQGAPADVFAGASTKYGTQLYKDGFVYSPWLFARNKLCVIVPAANRAGIRTLGDLAKHGVEIAIGDAAVPIGTYTRTVLKNINDSGLYGKTYSTSVLGNVVASCVNVSAVVALVKLDEVDAGFVYVSDPMYAGTSVKKLPIPAAYQSNPLPTYPIARVKTATHPVAAKDFINFVRSRLKHRGQAILKKWGFMPAPAS